MVERGVTLKNSFGMKIAETADVTLEYEAEMKTDLQVHYTSTRPGHFWREFGDGCSLVARFAVPMVTG